MERFIVGTGRCGSTLLSRMLAEEPSTCSLFEYFGGLDVGRRFAREPLSGAELADLIGSEQKVLTAVLRRGYPVAEVTYPFGRGRYRRDEPLPWILVSLLPRLGGDPDALFDEVMAFARARPESPAADHHRALFEWLTARTGRRHWIERSGSSIDYLGALVGQFPGARFVHLHRDAAEAALSMREHHAFRVPIAILYGAREGAGPAFAAVDFDAPPTADDLVSRVLSGAPPVAWYGRYWSDQMAHGLAGAASLATDALLSVRFEDLVAEPVAVLERIAAFFALPAGDWIPRAAALARGLPPRRAPELPAGDREALAAACRPGEERLARFLEGR